MHAPSWIARLLRPGTFIPLLVTIVAAAVCAKDGPSPAAPTPGSDTSRGVDDAAKAFAEQLQPMLKTHCFVCHSGAKAKGDLRLDTLTADFQSIKMAAAWKSVDDRLAARTMPPASRPQLSQEESRALRTWIGAELTSADSARQREEGRAVTRRLSRTEYVNTIRDLLAVDVPLKDLLPEDLPAADGFENDGLALRLSSVLIERYMEAADLALKAAFTHGPKPAMTNVRLSYKNERQYNLAKTEKRVAELENAVVLLTDKAPPLAQFRAQTAGRYRFRVSAFAHHTDGKPLVMAVHTTGPRALGHYAVPPDKPISRVSV